MASAEAEPQVARPRPDSARRERRAHLQSSQQKTIVFELRGEFIGLDSLLKATGLADSGGAGKVLVASGAVQVDGVQESRKTCKIRHGQVVSIGLTLIKVRAGKQKPETEMHTPDATANTGTQDAPI